MTKCSGRCKYYEIYDWEDDYLDEYCSNQDNDDTNFEGECKYFEEDKE